MTADIRTPYLEDAVSICQVVRRSIMECCTLDHKNEPQLIEAWLENKTPENVRCWLKTEGVISVVAEVKGEVVGFALASSLGEVMLCYLLPEVRFTGVGKAMLSAIEVQAASAGIATLFLDSTLTAMTFYLRYGFSPSGDPEVAFGIVGHPMSKPVVTSLPAQCKA